MKTMKLILSIVFLSCVVLQAQESFYGTSGYYFTPSAYVKKNSNYGASVDASVRFTSIRFSALMKERLEISFASTMGFVGDEGFSEKTFYAPIIPGAKFAIGEQKKGKQEIAYSVFFNLPYGLGAVGSWATQWPVLSPEFSGGIGIPSADFSHAYIFAGYKLRLCDLKRNPLPLAIIGDAAVSASLGELGTYEEAYVSSGLSVYIGRNFTFDMIYRIDPEEYVEINEDTGTERILPEQNQNGVLYLKLNFAFENMLKNTSSRENASKGGK